MQREIMNRRRVIVGATVSGLVPLLAPRVPGAQQQPYIEISYQSGGLHIQHYFYRPAGSGPFRTLI